MRVANLKYHGARQREGVKLVVRCSVPTLIHTHEMFAKIWGLREAGNPDSFYGSSERKADPGPFPGTLAR